MIAQESGFRKSVRRRALRRAHHGPRREPKGHSVRKQRRRPWRNLL